MPGPTANPHPVPAVRLARPAILDAEKMMLTPMDIGPAARHYAYDITWGGP